jgi:hypothetical protein
VDILWTGIGKQDMFLKKLEIIKENGWEIFETRAECRVAPYPEFSPHLPLHFILRRNAI